MVPNIQTGSGLMGHPPLDKVSNRLTGHRQLDKDCSKDNNIEMVRYLFNLFNLFNSSFVFNLQFQ